MRIKHKEQAFKASLARLERVKATLNPGVAPVTIATQQIAQQRARSKSTIPGLNKERKALLERKIEMENQISHDARQLKQIETELKKSLVKAPVDGTILKLDLRNKTQVVLAVESTAQIAPSNTPVIVKARVAAHDISKVQVCKQERVSDCKQGKVQLQISAYPYPDYDTLKAAVRAIAPVSLYLLVVVLVQLPHTTK